MGQYDLRFSIGLTLSDGGTIQEVMWDSAAFQAGLTAGSRVLRVNGLNYAEATLRQAVARKTKSIVLDVESRGRARAVQVDYEGGHRFPHLEPIEGARPRLNEIFASR